MLEDLASAPHSSDWMTPGLYLGMVVAIVIVIHALAFAVERDWA